MDWCSKPVANVSVAVAARRYNRYGVPVRCLSRNTSATALWTRRHFLVQNASSPNLDQCPWTHDLDRESGRNPPFLSKRFHTLNKLQPCFPVQHAHEIRSKAIRIPTRLSTFAAFLGEAQLPSALRSLLEIRRARLRASCRSRCLHWSAPDASVAASRQSWTPIRELRTLLVVFDGIEAIHAIEVTEEIQLSVNRSCASQRSLLRRQHKTLSASMGINAIV